MQFQVSFDRISVTFHGVGRISGLLFLREFWKLSKGWVTGSYLTVVYFYFVNRTPDDGKKVSLAKNKEILACHYDWKLHSIYAIIF